MHIYTHVCVCVIDFKALILPFCFLLQWHRHLNTNWKEEHSSFYSDLSSLTVNSLLKSLPNL